MTSILRGGANMALAPVRRLTTLVTATIDALTSTTAMAASATRASVDFLRRDRTAPAAALVRLGPLLLDVARDAHSEKCVQEVVAMLGDLLAILQREEVGAIVSASLSLARSQPVTDLVKHAASTLLALVHVLQTPVVDKVRAQLELYFSHLIGQPIASSSAVAPSLTLAQPGLSSCAASSGDSQRDLSECVQLLLLLESLSLPILLLSSPPHFGCQCPTDSAPVQRQRYLSPDESRLLRSLARQQDTQLLLLHRFSLELQRQQDGSDSSPVSLDSGTQTTPMAFTPSAAAQFCSLSSSSESASRGSKGQGSKSQRRSHSASEAPQRDNGYGQWGRPVDYSSGSNGSSSGSDAASDSGVEGSSQSPAGTPSRRATRSLSMGGRLPQGPSLGSALPSTAGSAPSPSLYVRPRQRGPSFAHVHQAAAAAPARQQEETKSAQQARDLQRRLDRCEADEHAAPWITSDEEGDEELDDEDSGEAQKEGSHCHDNGPSSSSASSSHPTSCPHHVPLRHARFVFCAREMLMERQSDATE